MGGGAHIDRYDMLFDYLTRNKGSIDWVDISPYMIDGAKLISNQTAYKERKSVITFINKDILDYLYETKDDTIDVAIMKYTFEHISDPKVLFELLSKKLKKDGFLISDVSSRGGKIKSVTTNARFFIWDKSHHKYISFENEYVLKDGDKFQLKFLKESGNPDSGYAEGLEVVKNYFSCETILNIARKSGLQASLEDWKVYIKEPDSLPELLKDTKLDLLIVRK